MTISRGFRNTVRPDVATARQRQLMVAEGFRLLSNAAALVPVGTPDYSDVSTESEARWVRLGGELETYRKLAAPGLDWSEDAATVALSEVKTACAQRLNLHAASN